MDLKVTRTTLPPLDEYIEYLRRIWDSHWITNNGPLVREFEQRLSDYLCVPQLRYVTNCTTALQISIKALGLRGEIITTPFSYVATTGAILWDNCTPVFADIQPDDLTIDPLKVEAAITPRTCAILATHVYGFPCDVVALESIAQHHGIKIIYDAAHAFGCRLSGKSLAAYGDISCLSFHATKVFHTAEGGAVVVNAEDPALTERVRLMRAFGHHGEDHQCVGINGKNSELHAAMGLCNLPRTSDIIAQRRLQHDTYRKLLEPCHQLALPASKWSTYESNYAYFPVLAPNESIALAIISRLAENNISIII